MRHLQQRKLKINAVGTKRREPFLEPLERRTLLTSVVVNTAVDAVFPPGSGTVSLRNAINTANASTTPTTITFDPKAFATPQTIKLNGSVLELSNLSHPTTITGPSASLTISGNDTTNVFQIDGSTFGRATATFSKLTIAHGMGNNGAGVSSEGNVTLSNVTIANNSGIGFFDGGTATLTNVTVSGNTGAGIDIYYATATLTNVTVSGNADDGIDIGGTATLTNVTVSGNKNGAGIDIASGASIATLGNVTVTGNSGGRAGIENAGTATLTNVTISNNKSIIFAGGFENAGTATLTDVTVSGNTADGNGGGIYNSGTLRLTRGTVSSNTAAGTAFVAAFGGGIYNSGGGIATLTNVTLSGNTASGGAFADDGGGIYNSSGGTFADGVATLTNVTISGNSAVGPGGGVLNAAATPNFKVTNSIIAGNAGKSGPDVSGGFDSLGYNVVGKTDGSTGWFILDRTGTIASPLNAKLGSLANNGGPTLTMLPLAGSPAIDHGLNLYIPKGITTDQRGLARIVNGTVDIGAVEVQGDVVVLPTISISATDGSATEPSTSTAAATDTGLYTVSRTGPTTAPLTVSFTINGTASNGTDYTKIVSPVTIPAGTASTTIKLTPKFDTLTEGTETAIVTLASGTGYAIDSTHKSATVSIHDPSKTPTAGIVASDPSASESPAGPTSTGSFILSRSGPTTAALSMTLTLSGTATYGTDFTLVIYGAASSSFNAATKQLTVSIATGKTAVSILITPLNDKLAESTETVILSLKSSTAYGITAGKTSATVSIANFS